MPGQSPVELSAALRWPFAGPLLRAQRPFGLALRLAQLGSGVVRLALAVAWPVPGQPVTR